MYGASPRACMGIDRAARAHAWLQGRDYVGPEDIQEVAADVLRHRLVLSFEAEADGIEPDSKRRTGRSRGAIGNNADNAPRQATGRCVTGKR
jgi:MoxR-like ATPase